ncbi:sensor histidine kinase [Paenibacillus agaridevorans]|uniref:sensor histidine kinase n=1 Tax=Paenibacillus agaridevorans TaxID=171404 RepID=UPI001BE4642D|nr:histidine kinase [Paenibacillus agaridevorans]
MNELGKKEVQMQLSNTMRSQIHYYFLSLQNEIQQIFKNQQEIINDEQLQNLVGMESILSDYEKAQAINHLQNKLKSFKESNVNIKDVSLYLHSMNDVITTANFRLSNVTKESMEEISEAIYLKGFPLTYLNDRLYVNLNFPSYPISEQSNESASFIFQMELSIDALRTALNNFHPIGETVLFGDTWSIGSEKDLTLFNQISSQLHYDRLSESVPSSISISGVKYLIFYERSLELDTGLLFYIPEDTVLGTLKSYQNWFWLLIISSLIIVILFSYFIYMLIHQPLRRLVEQFKRVEAGRFDVYTAYTNQDEFGYLFRQFDKMVHNLKVLIDDLYVQKIRLQHAELQQLQAQINPHFLYNSFFILHRLILNYDIDSAKVVSKNLGGYFQYITRNAKEEVSLLAEVNHARSYVEIQNVRFSNRIIAVFEELPDRFHEVQIPRLILQPIIENAYQHGLGEILERGNLIIRFGSTDKQLLIIVEDSGPGINELAAKDLLRKLNQVENGGESTGLINVHRRLQLKYGEGSGISIEQSSLGGLLVQMSIPFIGK